MCVVFLESSEAVFNPTWIRSHFLHSYLVVQPEAALPGVTHYRVAMVSRSTVPSSEPELRQCGLFAHGKALQQVMLSKVINAERASYHAPKFLKLTVSDGWCWYEGKHTVLVDLCGVCVARV